MRTLALLAALLLLAFQARAQALQETAEQVPAQNQPGAEDQPGDGDLNLLADEIRNLLEAEDAVRSLTGEERLTRQASVHLIQAFCKCQHANCSFIQSFLRAWGLLSKICGQ